MKKVINASRFQTKVCLVNKYGEVVCELERDGGWYVIPRNKVGGLLLDIGDEYRVEEVEFEVD